VVTLDDNKTSIHHEPPAFQLLAQLAQAQAHDPTSGSIHLELTFLVLFGLWLCVGSPTAIKREVGRRGPITYHSSLASKGGGVELMRPSPIIFLTFRPHKTASSPTLKGR
jgi:hypothetical protein